MTARAATNNPPRNIHQRLAKVMETITYIQKEKKAGMNYTIVSHDAVTKKVRPALLAEGIVYYPVRCSTSQQGNRTAADMTVRFVNIDDPADNFDVETFGYGVDSQDKGPGKAMSYAVKYALLKALGLETGDDPDEDVSPDADHVDQSILDLEQFEMDITRMTTPETLQALLDKHLPSLTIAAELEPAKVAQVRQKFSRHKKKLAKEMAEAE